MMSSGGSCPARPRRCALKAKGMLVDAWSPGRPGAVLTLEIPDPDQAARIVADFPLAQVGQITTEIIPLHSMDL
jgi:hypothetical protein